MNKFLILFLCVNLLILPAYTQIVDGFVEKSLDKSLTVKNYQAAKIDDELVENGLDQKQKIKNYNAGKSYVEDTFALKNVNAKRAVYKTVVISDDFLPKVAVSQINKSASAKRSVDSISVTVPIRTKNGLTTKSQPDEGSYLDFETVSDVKINNVIYPAGTNVQGRIETVSMNSSMGVPADLVIGNFRIKNIPLDGEIKKIGSNRSLWVYPCAYAGCLFFGAGLLLMPIRGGHAKIKADEIFTLNFVQ